ncbi:MAG: cation transporter [Clostridia bacterium]|nr:cation transporter [Clostridia bacterium]
MTALLLRIFVKDHKNTDSPKTRSAIGSLSGFVGIAANFVLFLAKLFIGTVSGSVAITADAMNNLTDASSSIVTLIGFKLAEKPADEDHPFGHARFEYLSGLVVAALILVIGFELAKTSVNKILSPSPVDFSIPLLIVLVISIAVKLWLSLFNTRLGKMINSSTLLATALDSRNDVISTFAVLLAAIIEAIFGWQIDGFVGLFIAGFILFSAFGLVKEIINPLLGEAADPQLKRSVVELLTGEEKVLAFHDLMVHDYGPGHRFASVHVEMDCKEDPMVCHDIIDDLERTCLAKHNVNLVIHYDPVVTGNEELSHMRETVRSILCDYDPSITIHDFRMVKGTSHTNLIFDIVLPYSIFSKKKEIKAYLDENLKSIPEGPYYTVVTFDPAAFS